MSKHTAGPVELLKDWHERINTIAAEMAFNVADEMESMLAAAPAVQGEPVEYQCHSCRKTAPPPAPFKAYVECDECGALTAAPIAARLTAPQPAPDVTQLVDALVACARASSAAEVGLIVDAAMADYRKRGDS